MLDTRNGGDAQASRYSLNLEWGISEGLIYENVELTEFDIREVIRKGCGQIKSAFGLDFGFTDPNAFICCAVDPGLNKIYVFDEWYKVGTTNKQIAEQIKLMGYGGQKIICDSAKKFGTQPR